MDSLCIKELTISTRIGVNDWEQRILQKLVIDISIPIDFTNYNDETTDYLDYDKLCLSITNFVETGRFRLIETVANEIAHLIQTEFNVGTLSLSVSKPSAVKSAKSVMIVVNR